MPVAAVMKFIVDALNDLQMPAGMNAPNLAAWITAPDPDIDPAVIPTAYIWPMPLEEQRATVPRNTGPGTPAGLKTIRHEIGVWLVWDQAEDDPDADMLFPGYIDALMDALRTAMPMPAILTDPWTGEQTQLDNVGEQMTANSPPPRTLADQRYLRYDAFIRVPVTEQIQALRGPPGRLGDHPCCQRALGDQQRRPAGLFQAGDVDGAHVGPADRGHGQPDLRLRGRPARAQSLGHEHEDAGRRLPGSGLGQPGGCGFLGCPGRLDSARMVAFPPHRGGDTGRADVLRVADCADRDLHEHVGQRLGDDGGELLALPGRPGGQSVHRRDGGRDGGGAVAALLTGVAAAVPAARVIGCHAS
jgi:hypothetical protein